MAASQPGAVSHRKKIDYYKWAVGIAVPIAVAIIGLYKSGSGGEKSTPGNFTYVGSVSVIENQYQQFMGQPLKDDATRAQIQAAVNLANAGQYDASRRLFEQLAATVPVPAVFTSVGALYAEKGDSQTARQFYEKAVAKDPNYKPALQNLSALKVVKPEERSLASGREVEPNNDIPHANIVPLGMSALGEISDPSDTDFFRFTAAQTPRDICRISIKNMSTTLAPGVSIYDGQKNYLLTSYRDTAGADLDYDYAPSPGANYYLQVYQRGNTSGPYSLTITPLHKYDSFEPNDDIPSAKPLSLGKTIDANIMDAGDTDFFRVKSAGAPGNLTATIKNTSTTLAPGVSIFDGQKNYLSTSYRDTAGADLDYAFPAQPNSIYYIQVYQRGNTSGSYSLTVK